MILVYNEYSTDNYKSLRIITEVIIKNQEMLRFVPDHLKTKNMGKQSVKQLPFIIRYVPEQYMSQVMHGKVILKNGGTLMFVSDCYKNKKTVTKLLLIMLMY